MTRRTLSTTITPNAAQIYDREAVAATRKFVARDWDSGLATYHSNDLAVLVSILASSTWHAWSDWAVEQVKSAHPGNMHPPKLIMARECARSWARTSINGPNPFSAARLTALKISAGDFLLPLYAIVTGSGDPVELDDCRDALERATYA